MRHVHNEIGTRDAEPKDHPKHCADRFPFRILGSPSVIDVKCVVSIAHELHPIRLGNFIGADIMKNRAPVVIPVGGRIMGVTIAAISQVSVKSSFFEYS